MYVAQLSAVVDLPVEISDSLVSEWGPPGAVILLLAMVIIVFYRLGSKTLEEKEMRHAKERRDAEERFEKSHLAQSAAHREERGRWEKENDRRHGEIVQITSNLSGQITSLDNTLREMSSTMGEIRGSLRRGA